MPYGNNLLRCIKCGVAEIGTDCVDLGYMCEECKLKEQVKRCEPDTCMGQCQGMNSRPDCKHLFDEDEMSETEQSLKDITEMISGEQSKEVPTPFFKRPMQALWVGDSKMMANIINGVKKITVRGGYRDYKVDKAVFVLDSEIGKATIAVVKNIKKVQWKKLGELAKEEVEADGFKNFDDMLKGMQVFYPESDLNSQVTVVEWD